MYPSSVKVLCCKSEDEGEEAWLYTSHHLPGVLGKEEEEEENIMKIHEFLYLFLFVLKFYACTLHRVVIKKAKEKEK